LNVTPRPDYWPKTARDSNARQSTESRENT
jgi:hypothetical protein